MKMRDKKIVIIASQKNVSRKINSSPCEYILKGIFILLYILSWSLLIHFPIRETFTTVLFRGRVLFKILIHLREAQSANALLASDFNLGVVIRNKWTTGSTGSLTLLRDISSCHAIYITRLKEFRYYSVMQMAIT